MTESLNDIIRAIGLIRTWTDQEGGIENALRPGSMSVSAIERQLLIVSEAAIRIHHADPNYVSAQAPEIDWPGVRGVGNVIRHRYGQLDGEVIERILRSYLDPLDLACRRLIDL